MNGRHDLPRLLADEAIAEQPGVPQRMDRDPYLELSEADRAEFEAWIEERQKADLEALMADPDAQERMRAELERDPPPF